VIYIGATEAKAWEGVPNYCDDLNEMHRLEMRLGDSYEDWQEAVSRLWGRWTKDSPEDVPLSPLSVPAWLRAKAYLEVKGD